MASLTSGPKKPRLFPKCGEEPLNLTLDKGVKNRRKDQARASIPVGLTKLEEST